MADDADEMADDADEIADDADDWALETEAATSLDIGRTTATALVNNSMF